MMESVKEKEDVKKIWSDTEDEDVNLFDAITIRLASPETIKN